MSPLRHVIAGPDGRGPLRACIEGAREDEGPEPPAGAAHLPVVGRRVEQHAVRVVDLTVLHAGGWSRGERGFGTLENCRSFFF